jgi:hypothetical protein
MQLRKGDNMKKFRCNIIILLICICQLKIGPLDRLKTGPLIIS